MNIHEFTVCHMLTISIYIIRKSKYIVQ